MSAFSRFELSFEEARKRLLFGFFSLISATMLILFGVMHLYNFELLEGCVTVVAGVALLVTVVVARNRVDAHALYRIPPILCGVLFLYFASMADPLGYRMLWLYAYPPMTFYLLGCREGLFFTVIVSLGWIAALTIPSAISGPVIYDPQMTLRFIASFSVVLAVSWFLEAVRGFYASAMLAHSSQLEHDRQQMHKLAYLDELTQLPNRRSAIKFLEASIAESASDDVRAPLVAMLDIDHFKVINDKFGHLVGDEVLMHVAQRIRHAIRAEDLVGRYGGEEFLIVFRSASHLKYQNILDKVRRAIGDNPIAVGQNAHRITVSIGAARAGFGLSHEEAIEAADTALYAAKQQGRNRAILARGTAISPEDNVINIGS